MSLKKGAKFLGVAQDGSPMKRRGPILVHSGWTRTQACRDLGSGPAETPLSRRQGTYLSLWEVCTLSPRQ